MLDLCQAIESLNVRDSCTDTESFSVNSYPPRL